MYHISFAAGQQTPNPLTRAYTFRYTQTPEPTQYEDCIGSVANPDHPEGFDNISFLTPESFGPGVKATLRCAFEGLGCPEIILVEKPEICPDGAVRYGACFECVLYRDGINIWRHYRNEEGKCSWHKRLGQKFPVSEGQIHELTLEVTENYLTFAVDGQITTLRTEDIFSRFHVGLTMCEGVVRVYDFQVETI